MSEPLFLVYHLLLSMERFHKPRFEHLEQVTVGKCDRDSERLSPASDWLTDGEYREGRIGNKV